MPWQRVPLAAVRRRLPSLYLEESVDAHAQQLLRSFKARVQTASDAGLVGRSDEDHFGHCWRRGKVLVTFDLDFFDYKDANLPDTRNPGVIVLDCDNAEHDQVMKTTSYLLRVPDIIGAGGWRHTRTVVGPTGNVRIRRRSATTSAYAIERYRFRSDDRLEKWVAR